MRKTSALLLACFMIFSLFIAGCSSSSSDDKGAKSGEKSNGGGILIYARGGDSTALDPAITTEGESFIVTDQIYETLINYGEDNTEIEPGLAESWEISDDNLTYTFKLREGIKFHDDTDFNAEAVVKNFKRWSQSKDEAKFAYYPSMFGGFEGDEGHVIKEVTASDEYTVVITLNRPQAPFLKNIAMGTFAMASPSAFEKYGDDFTKNPVGTGPFKFKSWKANDTIEVVKNEDYWQEGLPKLDGVIFKVIKDNSARVNALVKGEVDLMDGLNPSDLSQIEKNSDLQKFERPSLNVGYVGFNVEKEPFNKKEVRQAISHLINKEEIIANFFEGTAEPAKNPIPPSVSGYNDEIVDYEYNVEKAKELLAQAGYEDGFEFDLWAMPVPRPYMTDGVKIAEAIQASLKQVNIKANIVTYEWGTYIEKTQAGEAPVYMLGWNGDNGDADNFIYTLLDKDSIGANNYSRYDNPELHEILIEAQSISDEEQRNELYKQAQVIIHEDAPWVPLVHSKPLLAGSVNVEGFIPHPTGTQSFINVSLN